MTRVLAIRILNGAGLQYVKVTAQSHYQQCSYKRRGRRALSYDNSFSSGALLSIVLI